MKREFTVHFKVIHHDKSSLLRGIIFLEENQKPTLNDYEQCLPLPIDPQSVSNNSVGSV